MKQTYHITMLLVGVLLTLAWWSFFEFAPKCSIDNAWAGIGLSLTVASIVSIVFACYNDIEK